MRIEYLVDKELDMVSGGEQIVLAISEENIVALPLSDTSRGGLAMLAHNPFAETLGDPDPTG